MKPTLEKAIVAEAAEIVKHYIDRINPVPTAQLRRLCVLLEEADVLERKGKYGYAIKAAGAVQTKRGRRG